MSHTYRFLDFATVNNKHDIIDGNACLGNVGCYDNLPHSLWWSVKYLHMNKACKQCTLTHTCTYATYKQPLNSCHASCKCTSCMYLCTYTTLGLRAIQILGTCTCTGIYIYKQMRGILLPIITSIFMYMHMVRIQCTVHVGMPGMVSLCTYEP